MKKFMLMALALLSLLSLGVFFNWKTDAANSNTLVTLWVSWWTWYCITVWSINVWSTWASYSVREISSWFATNSFYCVDQSWSFASRSMTVQASNPLIGSSTWQIAASNISMSTASQSLLWWNCSIWGALTKVEINSTARTLLNKVNFTWSICSIQTTPSIFVSIPASTPTGTYTWNITLTYPSAF